MSTAHPAAHPLRTLTISGGVLDLNALHQISTGAARLSITSDPNVASQMKAACRAVDRATDEGWSVYGVTTGFGGMADVPVPYDMAAASQNNLLSFLATGIGDPVDRRHVRAAMALRANVLLRGHSGVRLELVDRLVKFLNADAIPVVRALGSIGASGDLVPLASIARAITGHATGQAVCVDGRYIDNACALKQLDLEPIQLRSKEGLALVNGTSFSAAIAANCVNESRQLMALTLNVNAIMMAALNVQQQPFEPFVHELKPHPGQQWTAQIMMRLLNEGARSKNPDRQPDHNGHPETNGSSTNGKPQSRVQDRYALRCFPQYFGSIVENLARIGQTVTTEMNGVSDNPLVDSRHNTFFQSGNFLGQYISRTMDDLRTDIGMMAKHLDVQIATLVAPEFSRGLPPSLQGNSALPFNMGLKGLQITGNSIMPMLSWYGNPIASHYPTHAEQFNQNINGLSWGSANLAWDSIGLFQKYLATALIFAAQAIDLRAKQTLGHFDGRQLLSNMTVAVYQHVYNLTGQAPGARRPLVFDDGDQSLEYWLADLVGELEDGNKIAASILPITESFEATFLAHS